MPYLNVPRRPRREASFSGMSKSARVLFRQLHFEAQIAFLAGATGFGGVARRTLLRTIRAFRQDSANPCQENRNVTFRPFIC
jgi:ABC-type transport system involved in cytochrome c biogenesis ATPase subunit